MSNENPYATENLAKGGGRWDDLVVVLTSLRYYTKALTYKDGRPVPKQGPDKKPIPGTQATKHLLEIKGVPVGQEKESTRELSTGQMQPSPDGEYLVPPKDKPDAKLHESCEVGMFFKGLNDAGYDTSKLYPRISAGRGLRIHFKEEPQKDGKGNVKKSSDGRFTETTPVPLAVLGEGQVSAPAGNGVAEKTDAAILELLKTGPLTKVELLAKLSARFAGDPEANTIIGSVVQDQYHSGKAWKFDGTTLSL